MSTLQLFEYPIPIQTLDFFRGVYFRSLRNLSKKSILLTSHHKVLDRYSDKPTHDIILTRTTGKYGFLLGLLPIGYKYKRKDFETLINKYQISIIATDITERGFDLYKNLSVYPIYIVLIFGDYYEDTFTKENILKESDTPQFHRELALYDKNQLENYIHVL